MKEYRVSHSVWRELNMWFPMSIRELLGFQKEALEGCAWRHIGKFLEYDRGRSSLAKKFYSEPHHPTVSLMDVQKDFGENERNIGNQHGIELALLSFARQPIDPTHLMINRWCCEAT
jgi:hypothetical protein